MEISSQGQFRENGTIHKNLWVLLVLWTMLVTEVCVNVKTLRISLNTTNSSRGFAYNLTLKISIYETTANILTKPTVRESRNKLCEVFMIQSVVSQLIEYMVWRLDESTI
jgi:hypothetical protein